MKPDTEAPGAVPARQPRRGVRLFVALHLVAIGTIYAVAWVVGGGFAGPPMPVPTAAMPNLPAIPPAPVPTAPRQQTQTVAQVPLPEWTRRAEVAAPWAAGGHEHRH